MNKKWKLWKKLSAGIIGIFVVAFSIVVLTLFWQQDKIVQNLVTGFNEDFKGAIIIGDTDISPFANFPFISVVIENVQVFEDKEDMFAPILDVSHIYLGFNFWSLISGNINVNLLKVENGNFDIVRYEDGSFNLVNALSGEMKIKDIKEEYNIELQKIELANLDIIKYDESTNIHAETYIETATSKFKNSESSLAIGLKSQLILNVINDGDSTIFKNKHINAVTELNYEKTDGILTIHPSEIMFENGVFDIDGNIAVHDDFDIDLRIHGNNPNFNLLIAFAPEELIPVLEQYENSGKIYFDASVKGKSLSGHLPAIEAEFGCDSAYFSNPISHKKLEEIAFKGRFTNGAERNASTMEFILENFTAKPEAGTFHADLSVKNFNSPEIDLSVNSNFDLDFLAKFLNVTSLQDLDGDVSISMNFRDIIDLQNPEKSLAKFSQSYYSELDVRNLSFKIPGYHLPFDSIDIKASMDGNHATIDYLYMNIGSSDLSIRGEIDDFPALVHQTTDTVNADLFIFSARTDLIELSSEDTINEKPIDEEISNLRLELAFKSTAKTLMNSKNLPEGDFFIKNFYGKLKQYPHTFRKFNAHLIIGEKDIDILELNGNIDKSDIQYAGKLYEYPVLLQDSLNGTIDLDFSMKSPLLKPNDLLTYKGENYLPVDYRKEEITELEMFGNAQFHFEDSLKRAKIFFDQLNANLEIHSMEIKDIHGKIQLLDDYFLLNNLSGKIGNTDFFTNMSLYSGSNDSIRKSSNFVTLSSELIDFDQLSNYSITYSDDSTVTIDHDSAFNIYTLPFTDLNIAMDIDQLNYHKHKLIDINADLRAQENHFLFVDTLTLATAGGYFDISGYFDGSNSDSIFFYPSIKISNVNMSQLLYRFDNFGQDYILAENLVGQLSGEIKGKLHMHADMVPLIQESDIQVKVEIIDGELRNYEIFNALSEYFTDKNLSKIRFDTLSNEFQMSQGILTIPAMTINSTLGFIEISGKQDMDNHMEYYFRVPIHMITKAASKKLFGKKVMQADSTHIDEIQYKNSDKKTWYINFMLVGTPDDYKVSLGRKKKS